MFTPLTTLAALQTSAVVSVDGDTRIIAWARTEPLPQLFAHMVHRHLAIRPNPGPRAEWPATRGYSPACDPAVTSRRRRS